MFHVTGTVAHLVLALPSEVSFETFSVSYDKFSLALPSHFGIGPALPSKSFWYLRDVTLAFLHGFSLRNCSVYFRTTKTISY